MENNDEMYDSEGVAHTIQMNKFLEKLDMPIEGQDELIPVAGRDYVLQMIVALDFTTINADKTRIRHTLKRSGGYKLIAVPRG